MHVYWPRCARQLYPGQGNMSKQQRKYAKSSGTGHLAKQYSRQKLPVVVSVHIRRIPNRYLYTSRIGTCTYRPIIWLLIDIPNVHKVPTQITFLTYYRNCRSGTQIVTDYMEYDIHFDHDTYMKYNHTHLESCPKARPLWICQQ